MSTTTSTAWLQDCGSLRAAGLVIPLYRHSDTAKRLLCSARSRIVVQVQSMSKDLWALDFDGVVCNSVGESSKSAWQVV